MTGPAARLERRFRRIMLMLPYAIRNPGCTVHELAQRFGATDAEITQDLTMLGMCGLPGYDPGNLIDVAMIGDAVEVDTADYFSKPLRLTPEEAAALYTGGAALAQLPGMEGADSLRSALDKLGAALRSDPSRVDAGGIELDLEMGAAANVAALQQALTEPRRIKIEYLSATSGRITTREVDPRGLVAALGRLYLIAWDYSNNEERVFRTDRIKSVAITATPAADRGAFDPTPYRRAWLGEGRLTVTLELSPGASRWFDDYYPVLSSRMLDDGWTEVSLPAGGKNWAATLIVRLGHDARNVSPESVLDAARELAGAIAARHSSD